MLSDSDREQAAEGALILHRLVPAPDHGAGFRRDPETGFVYYSSEWLSDDAERERATSLLHRLVPAPDHGAGFRRDPETGFVYYSSEWLSDEREAEE